MSFQTNTIVIQNRADKFVVLTKAKEETEKSFMVIQFSRNSFEQHASKQFTYDLLKLLCPNSYKLIKI